MIRAAVFSLLALNVTPANALSDVPAGFVLMACESGIEELRTNCEMYIAGALAMNTLLSEAKQTDVKFCIPKDVSMNAVRFIWSGYIKANPEWADKPAAISLSNAMLKSFKCK